MTTPRAAKPFLPLTTRQIAVLRLAAEMSNQQVAAELGIAKSTVETHLSDIKIKLNAFRKQEAVAIARSRGLI